MAVVSFAKDYLNGAELGEKLPKSNVPVLLDKFLFIEQIISHFAALFNDISLAQYDIRRCRMIYLPAASMI